MSTYPRVAPGRRHASGGWAKPYGPVHAADNAGPYLAPRSGRLWPLQALAVALSGWSGIAALTAGTRQALLTVPLADRCSRILAVDVSARLLERLATKAAAQGVANIQRLMQPLETLEHHCLEGRHTSAAGARRLVATAEERRAVQSQAGRETPSHHTGGRRLPVALAFTKSLSPRSCQRRACSQPPSLWHPRTREGTRGA
jgi:hypothetical protein